MAVNQQAIDRIKLDEAFATETYLPFNDCWTVSMEIDNKLIKEHVGGICDCALFDDKRRKPSMCLRIDCRRLISSLKMPLC